MEYTRREAVGIMAAFAALANAAEPGAFARAQQMQPSHAVDVAGYWTNFYDDTVTTKGANKAALANAKRKTVYLHSPDSGQAVVYAENIPKTQLPAISGDVLVKMAVSQYRPGKGDISTDVSHIRIDATQTFDYMNLVAPLSWAVLASLAPPTATQTAKLPTLDSLGLNDQAKKDAGGQNLHQMTLPSGLGKLAVNVTKPSNPVFAEIIKTTSTAVSAGLSMMVLPAISVPAIKIFSELLGKWQGHATVIMNGNLTPVIATSVTPANVPMPQDPMPLPSGYYVMVPEEHQAELNSELPNLVVQNGFLVHKDAPQTDDLQTRAKGAVQGVSYVTLRMYCDKAPANGCSNPPTTTGTA
jgi:hypothetical protein